MSESEHIRACNDGSFYRFGRPAPGTQINRGRPSEEYLTRLPDDAHGNNVYVPKEHPCEPANELTN